jgi:hypothetical protein
VIRNVTAGKSQEIELKDGTKSSKEKESFNFTSYYQLQI